jgi:hypothetical protein
LASERAPWWAAHWLAGGRGGPAPAELAGLNGRDPHAIRDLLPAAPAELGIVVPAADLAAAGVVFTDLARLRLSGRASERWVVDKVTEIAENRGYDNRLLRSPLARLWTLDDEWSAGWGRTQAELAAEVRAACAQQLNTPDQ